MQDRIAALMQASPVTGVAVAMIENDTIKTACVGEFEGQVISEQTIWPVASLTKPVFVYGVLQLVQQGLLELDRPLQDYLPAPYAHQVEFLAEMTARQAMSHTTGLPNWRDAQGLRTSFRPGSQFSYSSEGLNYLQYVVEHLLGTSMDVYLEKHLFSPLGMSHTVLRQETEGTLPPNLTFLANTLPANGALSLWTSVENYARFMQTLLDTTASDSQLLNADWRKAMLTPQVDVGVQPHLRWGLGWGLEEQAGVYRFWHWGARGMPKTMNFVMGWPEQQRALVILTHHAEGLVLCQAIVHDFFPQQSLRAFDWLLPPQRWRPDGQLPNPPSLG